MRLQAPPNSTRPLARIARFIAVALLTLALFASIATPTAGAQVNEEAQFIALINELRADVGVAPLAVHGELTGQARHWSNRLAELGHLEHATHLADGLNADWVLLGENIGIHSAADVHDLFDAFVASPLHYENMVNPRFEYIGVGVVFDADGGLWTTQRYMEAPAVEAAVTIVEAAPVAIDRAGEVAPTALATDVIARVLVDLAPTER